jgi:hypothetical protein
MQAQRHNQPAQSFDNSHLTPVPVKMHTVTFVLVLILSFLFTPIIPLCSLLCCVRDPANRKAILKASSVVFFLYTTIITAVDIYLCVTAGSQSVTSKSLISVAIYAALGAVFWVLGDKEKQVVPSTEKP